ncbi:MAG TPA: HEAT repeat domain-containing protein [Kofleriaceae bacterium]|nr:HEAT repeat domain-containing protein [Kofleriaceae bacterium]
MFGRGNRIAKLVAVAVLALAVPHRAHAADRVTELTSMLSSSSEKTRISAVLSLARLGDKSALKPLVTALHDPSAQVRAIAATALGKLGHKAALPALKSAATDDVDETVRQKAAEAAASVAKLNHLDESPAEKDASAQARVQQKTSGFGRSPHAVTDRPDLFITVKGANDDSPGTTDKATRKLNADLLKASLQTSLAKAPQVTMAPDEAGRWGLDVRSVDISVVKLELSQDGNYMVMAAELRLAISDDKGKMLSFLSGGAKVQIPRSKYSAKILPNMRKDALEGAMQGMFDKLLVHLRQITTT